MSEKISAKASKPKKSASKKKLSVSPQPLRYTFALFLVIGLVGWGYVGYSYLFKSNDASSREDTAASANYFDRGTSTQKLKRLPSAGVQQVQIASRRTGLEKTADELLHWISANSNLTVPSVRPDIRIVSSKFMNKQLRPADGDNSNASGYNFKEDYIMLLKYDRADKGKVASMVHELVHYMQWKSPKRSDYDRCPGSAEVLAYGIEAKWRIKMGMDVWWSPKDLKVMSRC